MIKEHHNERGKPYRRILDKLIGVPIVFILGLLRKKQNKPQCVKSIGLLINVAIGDTTIATGVIESIKQDFKDVRITLFVGGSNYEVAMLIGNIDVVKLPVLNIFQSIRILRNYNFDIWIDFGQWARINAICSFFVKSKYKIGFKTAGQFRHYIYDKSVPHSGLVHEIENFRVLAAEAGVYTKLNPHFNIKQQTKENYVIFHLYAGGSRSHLKEWDISNWKSLIEYASTVYDKIYFTGAPSDMDKIDSLIAKCSKTDKLESLAGKTTIKELLLYLSKASLVVSIDTGVMHLASAVGANLIALHGPTHPSRWGALNENSKAVFARLQCSPCLSLGFESKCEFAKCMNDIDVKTAIDAMQSFEH